MKSPADMYDLALSSGYNLYYAVDVYFARLNYLEVNYHEEISKSEQPWFCSYRYAYKQKKLLRSNARRHPFVIQKIDGKWLVIDQSPLIIPET